MKPSRSPSPDPVNVRILPAHDAPSAAAPQVDGPRGDCFDARAGRLAGPASAAAPALVWHQRLASWRVRRQLDSAAATANEPAAWAHRRAAFEHHVRQMDVWQSAYWAGKQLLASLCWPRIAVSYLLFPAKFFRTARIDPAHLSWLRDKHGIEATPQGVITKDHAVLDGLRLQHPRDAHAPGLLVCLGNGMQFADQGMVPDLARLAMEARRPVYVYNYRGVGRSVGALHSTGAAVTDVAACIEAVAAAGRTSLEDVGLLGVSIGGGCGAAAIARLQRLGRVGPGGIGSFVAVHSFRSLPAVLTGLFGRLGGGITSTLLRLTGNDVLDTQAAARRAPLACVSLVVSARRDTVVVPRAALGRLPDHETLDTKRKPYNARFADVGSDHCDLLPLLESRPAMSLLRPDFAYEPLFF